MVTLFNPLTQAFSYEYQDENNQDRVATIPIGGSEDFPEWLATLLIKHIVDAWMHERKRDIATPEERYEVELIIRGITKPLNLPRNIVQLDKK